MQNNITQLARLQLCLLDLDLAVGERKESAKLKFEGALKTLLSGAVLQP
jgi:hypothetical protein